MCGGGGRERERKGLGTGEGRRRGEGGEIREGVWGEGGKEEGGGKGLGAADGAPDGLVARCGAHLDDIAVVTEPPQRLGLLDGRAGHVGGEPLAGGVQHGFCSGCQVYACHKKDMGEKV